MRPTDRRPSDTRQKTVRRMAYVILERMPWKSDSAFPLELMEEAYNRAMALSSMHKCRFRQEIRAGFNVFVVEASSYYDPGAWHNVFTRIDEWEKEQSGD